MESSTIAPTFFGAAIFLRATLTAAHFGPRGVEVGLGGTNASVSRAPGAGAARRHPPLPRTGILPLYAVARPGLRPAAAGRPRPAGGAVATDPPGEASRGTGRQGLNRSGR